MVHATPALTPTQRAQCSLDTARMHWLCIDATREGVVVVCFLGGFDLYVYTRVAEIRHRPSGDLIALLPVASA